MRLGVQRIVVATSGELVDADDLLVGPVHDRDDGERVGVEVSILISLAGVCGEDEALEETAVLVCGI